MPLIYLYLNLIGAAIVIKSMSQRASHKVVGIDLAGVEHKPSGFCEMDSSLKARVKLVYGDDELIDAVQKAEPNVVAIDAPLALPKGRRSLEERSKFHLRECDKELLRRGIKFFPITLGAMRKLTERGMRLRKRLESKGYEVIEVYPGAAQDILKIPRKQKGLEALRKGLERIGVKGLRKKMSGDELDAVTSALVGLFYLKGMYEAVGDEEEILMILPKPHKA